METTVYRDLAAFGLPLITPAHPDFAALVAEIESRPDPFGSPPIEDLPHAAVLVNDTGRAIVGLAHTWRYITAAGHSETSGSSNLGSSMQLDVLMGRTPPAPDIGTFILPGSKRLITERRVFGNNLDVLDRAQFAGGGRGGGGGGVRPHDASEIVSMELTLDLAILDDGRCLGPDEGGLFDSLVAAVESIRSAAQQAGAALRDGASAGRIFELLRPLARSPRGRTPSGQRRTMFARMFADMGIRQLIDSDPGAAAAWFEAYAQPPLRLRRHP